MDDDDGDDDNNDTDSDNKLKQYKPVIFLKLAHERTYVRRISPMTFNTWT